MQNEECRIFGVRPRRPVESCAGTTARRRPSSGGHRKSEIENRKFVIRNSSDGQAMVELTVALIVIVILLAGLIQIGQITAAHSRTMTDARTQAAEAAMAAEYSQPLNARYIYTWMPGPDNKPYTRDDSPFVVTNSSDNIQSLTDMARPGELKTYVPNNALSSLNIADDSMQGFFLVHGQKPESCPTLSAIRKLAYDRESISVKSDVWLVWTEGIY